MNDKILDNEPEAQLDEQESIEEVGITKPFSTKDIRVTHATLAMSSLINRLKHEEIDLQPDFQRNFDLWNHVKMSRLIESILLRLPLPVFYFDVSDPNKWIVVDGLQRLSTIKKFIIDRKLKLRGLEFLEDLEGMGYGELERNHQRIIDETQVITYQIEAQTPKAVRYSIFNRINTGGLSLNGQEIRQALNQNGDGINRLNEICQNDIFKRIVSISPKRMADKELALRFIALRLWCLGKLELKRMEDLLDDAMENLDNSMAVEDFENLRDELMESLEFSEKVFGERHRFSRSIGLEGYNNTLNKSLFDVITTCFSEVQDKSAFVAKRDFFLEKFQQLLREKEGNFSSSITSGTNARSAVEARFKIMRNLIEATLKED